MRHFNTIVAVALLVGVFTGCKQSMVISQVDYSQSIESVLSPDEDGMINDERMGVRFSILPLQYIETEDTTSVTTEEVHSIRDNKGYIYVTAPEYSHVFIMKPGAGELILEEQVEISENGISQPAFNQREDYIQLIDRSSNDSWRLNAEGIAQEPETENDEESQDG